MVVVDAKSSHKDVKMSSIAQPKGLLPIKSIKSCVRNVPAARIHWTRPRNVAPTIRQHGGLLARVVKLKETKDESQLLEAAVGDACGEGDSL